MSSLSSAVSSIYITKEREALDRATNASLKQGSTPISPVLSRTEKLYVALAHLAALVDGKLCQLHAGRSKLLLEETHVDSELSKAKKTNDTSSEKGTESGE